ncbi:acyltransferase [Aliarcobacter butzleri]|uniref:Acyltransferase n=1 Tax=Aliarcobacter butzleri TaxID=28197 RepID=A0AAP4PX03_9BACT|nr:hypothetical protein [Aliarcobacter butzleri]MDN5051242.1 hypothetical protein [Aliarcobacter butzleri]MDN5075435.1 hypothetical protein [Aliarcobacter butzleri]MDN5117035.1 hypothetical protein [Aliarcobacter butzleri]MDN5131514.1 hypothetical protein [Aliarcobacter butzleri]NUW26535.1 hypothetical protein [Aliarcobacter butzleri]
MNNDNIFFDISKLKSCGKNVIIGKTVRIRNPEKVSIGNNVIIDDFTYISGEVEIGDYVHVGASSTLSASKSKITMKEFSGISSGCRVYAGSSNYIKGCLDLPTIPEEFSFGSIFEEVCLNRFVLIGANTVILPGTNLPEGIACGANLVLKKSIEYKEWTIISEGRILPRRGKEKILSEIKKFYK